MRIVFRKSPHGIAMIVVMIAIFVLSVLAGAFAYSMKVETRLAQNANNEASITWLGRSGVELARYVLAQQMRCPYDSLNQKWAGGPGGECDTNGPLSDISLQNFHVGAGTVSIKITDEERKFNINTANEAVLQQALTLVGVDASEIPSISSAILDWIDPDDMPHINGAESDYYQGLNPPYYAKNGPIDDLSELLLVRGITLDMYWGSTSTNHALAAFQKTDRWGRPLDQPMYPFGLVDLFTPISSGRININTASETVLQMIPGIDQTAAACIVQQRAGPDGEDGTDDDIPFRNVGELVNCVNPQLVPQIARYCDVHSRTFKVEVDAKIAGYRRTFYALIVRNNPRDLRVLSFWWK